MASLHLPKCEVDVPLEIVEGVGLELHGEWGTEMAEGMTHNKAHMVVTPGGMEGEVDTSQEEEEAEGEVSEKRGTVVEN